jgi:hypothetical protein
VDLRPSVGTAAAWNSAATVVLADGVTSGEATPVATLGSVVDTNAVGANLASTRPAFRPVSAKLVGNSADAALLLLDEALSALDSDESIADDEPIAFDSADGEEPADLALAAAFDDQSDWWKAL